MSATNRKKIFVLDTSVLLSSPNAVNRFAEHEVVIPLVVLKELEGKRHDATLGFPAREALRCLNEISTRGDINTGVVVNDLGGTVRIEINHVSQAGLPDALSGDRTHDTRILAVAKNLANEHSGSHDTSGSGGSGGDGAGAREVIVVSKDMPMRLLAKTLGLGAEEYRNEQFVVDRPFSGIERVEVTSMLIDRLYDERSLPLEELEAAMIFGSGHPGGSDVAPVGHPDETAPHLLINTGLALSSDRGTALARVTASKRIELIEHSKEAFGVKGRSAEQRIALAHLLDPDVPIVSLGGVAGSGKTFLAIASALEQVMETGAFEKVIVFRPLFAVGGQDLGYLPGSAEEKMAPWAAAVWDALSAMTNKNVIEEIQQREMLEVLPLTHIRGRTLARTVVVIDEAQNLERPTLLTALSRIAEDSKVVLSWDAAQRDNLRVGRHDGIAAVVERLKGNPLFAHVQFTKSERGRVASLVGNLMDDFGA